MKSTVVLFGGTFNPPHMGHLHCIRSVIDRFSPTKFIMIPSFSPAIAEGISKDVGVSFDSRVEMCQLLLKDSQLEEKVEISKVEAEITPPSYTYKTLEVLKSELVAYTEVSFLVGDDQLSGFHSWFEARKILKTVNLIVVRRSQDTDFDELINSLSKNLDFKYTKKDNVYTILVDDIKSSISIVNLTPIKISSTEIRTDINKGLTESLFRYIEDNKLYLGE